MTIATIFSTASLRLWQKFTRALPLGPILPNMMPVQKWAVICKCEVWYENINTFIVQCCFLSLCQCSHPWWQRKWRSPGRSCPRWCQEASALPHQEVASDPAGSSGCPSRYHPESRRWERAEWWFLSDWWPLLSWGSSLWAHCWYDTTEKKHKMNLEWMKIGLKCPHPRAIQDVDEFVSSSEQICRNVALHHLLTNRSSAVNGCRQNESPNSW